MRTRLFGICGLLLGFMLLGGGAVDAQIYTSPWVMTTGWTSGHGSSVSVSAANAQHRAAVGSQHLQQDQQGQQCDTQDSGNGAEEDQPGEMDNIQDENAGSDTAEANSNQQDSADTNGSQHDDSAMDATDGEHNNHTVDLDNVQCGDQGANDRD
ncbi:MAG TPA: hypothetical protein VFL82_15100 [Thermomicrobiales bacterium]|nr:hypothetical protein [Thermomicrobiales bacterium]